MESNSGMDKALKDGMNKGLIDGKYKKTAYVKILNGQTISIKCDLLDTVDSARKKDKNPKRAAAPCESRKSPEGQDEDRRLQLRTKH